MEKVSVYVKKALLENSTEPSREQLLKEVEKLVDRLYELRLNNFRSDQWEMNMLNPYFGFSSPAYVNCSFKRGCHSLFLTNNGNYSHFRISVNVIPYGFGSNTEYNVETKDLTVKQLQGIYALLSKLIRDREDAIENWMSNEPLDNILPEIEKIAHDFLKDKPNYSAKISYGSRVSDGDSKYFALVVYENKSQIGSISLKQDSYGAYRYNVRIPLCGEWMRDDELKVSTLKEQIEEAIKEIIR